LPDKRRRVAGQRVAGRRICDAPIFLSVFDAAIGRVAPSIPDDRRVY